ncbi:hypothetical protein CBM2587_B90468 [Cupriavidus taiwanensis]|uniref:Uncharacterized protein n=1 Tax=Cupriavidus taiwanensis TaxID=164546 RepID=A0A375CDT4_9BURK|nr:hypothetical protein CBM2587_B90468 [Cupriavidus taiwanensis]
MQVNEVPLRFRGMAGRANTA